MVKKLFKHEFIAYMRALLPMHLIMLGVGALTRFVYFFEGDTTIFKIIGGSSVVAFVISCIVCAVLTFANTVTRFYKNMYTHEGYLTFTLPVTNDQHILVKAATAVAVIVLNFFAIFISICVATAGEFTIELFYAIGYIAVKATENVGWQLWLYILELVVWLLVSLFGQVFLFYSCISLGQLSNKNRIAMAIGVYFIYYFITQVFSTGFIVMMSVISYTDWFIKAMDSLGLFAVDHPYVFVHLVFLISIVFSAVYGALFYFITRTVMKKKLNLE